jgi:hypothetical protein
VQVGFAVGHWTNFSSTVRSTLQMLVKFIVIFSLLAISLGAEFGSPDTATKVR